MVVERQAVREKKKKQKRIAQASSSGTSSIRAPRVVGCELSESTTSSTVAVVVAPAVPFFDFPFSFSPFSLFFFLDFFLGTSHSHRGMNESTCHIIRVNTKLRRKRTQQSTYEANVRKELREYPDTWACNNNSDDVENQSNNSNGEK